MPERRMKIEIADIRKNYGRKEILQGVSFSARGGECVGILGGNGCGKTTLLSILAGVVRPASGRFLLDGQDLLADPKKRMAAVGYVPQGTPLMEELTALDNLRLWYGRRALREELSSREGIPRRLGVDSFLHTPVRKLSGGMKKRLTIACAMAKHPPVLLLDEPTAALDIPCKEEIHGWLSEHRAKGGILLLVTHDLLDLTLCDRLLLLRDGIVSPFPKIDDPSRLAKAASDAMTGVLPDEPSDKTVRSGKAGRKNGRRGT